MAFKRRVSIFSNYGDLTNFRLRAWMRFAAAMAVESALRA
jgi:hypothetical protein